MIGQAADPKLARIADTLAEKISQAKKVVVPQTGHSPHMQLPAEFNRVVQEFLQKEIGAAR